jgi:hypothetical protein
MPVTCQCGTLLAPCSAVAPACASPNSEELALRAAPGQFILCLFVFVPRLSFYEACEASIFYYIAVILRQDCHVASYLDMGAKTVGCGFAAGILAGIVV